MTGPPRDLELAELLYAGGLGAGEQQCRVCGCVEQDACVLAISHLVGVAIPCWWVYDDLCSNCAVQPIVVAA